jgi:DNA-binding NtrC family response regulator
VSAAALGLPVVPGDPADLLPVESAGALEEPAGPAIEPLPGLSVTASDGGVLSLAELEKQAIRRALQQTAGNRTRAAELLGISIRTMRNKLQEYREAGDAVDPMGDATE